MKKKLIIILGWLMLLQGIVHLQAQSLNAWEYWFNDDYAGRVTSNIGAVTNFRLNTSIPASSLPAGMNTLHIRFRDTEGRWSTPLTQVFFKGGQHVATFEYWFNEDYDNKTIHTANNTKDFLLTANVSTDDLTAGMHQMHYRFKDAGGIYSQVESRRFWKSGQTLTEYVYWFDDNIQAAVSGEMLGAVSETWSHEINVERGLNFDHMHLRFRDASDYWSSVLSIEAPPPLADFFAINDRYFVTFNNTTRLGSSFLWDFDDDTQSSLANPSHTYEGPGEYHVCLVAENKMGADTLCRYVTLPGISSIMPEKAGNAGYATLTVNGGGLTEATTVVLTREGHQTIHADTTILMEPGRLHARFNLSGKPLGEWDVEVRVPQDTTMTVSKGLVIEEGRPVDFWAEVSGRDVVMVNRWQTFTVNYGNLGNNDIFSAPIWLLVSDVPGLELEFLSKKPELPLDSDELWEAIRDSVPLWFPIDSIGDMPFKARVYPLFIPLVKASETNSFTFRIKSPENYRMITWVNPDWFTDLKSSDFERCIRWAQLTAFADGLVGLLANQIPGAGCAVGIVKELTGYEYGEASLSSAVWALTRAAIECVWDVGSNIPIIKAYSLVKEIYSLASNIYANYEAIEDCKRKFKPDKQKEKPIAAVTSFDPNEIVGPGGFTEKNYNFDDINFPYMIYFENLDDATAPAQEVFVYDTLDTHKFDLSSFEFGNISFGDTIIYVEPGLTSYTNDIDLRPSKDLILRINGQLDMETAVVRWSFVSLDPATMDLTEDPFGGFLPPNVNTPEGEGYVSFNIKLKEGLDHGTVIENKATIIFDLNKPITTNTWVNAIDHEPPISAVNALDTEVHPPFLISWEGHDDHSGIKYYSVYYSKDGGEPVLWKLNTRHKTDIFQGETGSVYRFYSEATDSIGNQEYKAGVYDTMTTVLVSARETVRSVSKFDVFPNPAKDQLHIAWQSDAAMNLWFVVYDVFGKEHNRKYLEHAGYGEQSLTIDISQWEKGIYFCVMEHAEGREVRKLVVN